jgi:hypothetical protein
MKSAFAFRSECGVGIVSRVNSWHREPSFSPYSAICLFSLIPEANRASLSKLKALFLIAILLRFSPSLSHRWETVSEYEKKDFLKKERGGWVEKV